MEGYNELLKAWCEYLLSRQTEEGGFDCEACGFSHGRADNAVYPFSYMYLLTGDKRYAAAIRLLLRFREGLTDGDGGVYNDTDSRWKGTTVFSAICISKALDCAGDSLPADIVKELTSAFKTSAKWVYENIVPGFGAYINYFAAAALVNLMYGKQYSDKKYTKRGRELFDYCAGHITPGGILTGEGQPHSFTTKNGCVPVDIGYNAEESLPCLVEAALLLEDAEAVETVKKFAFGTLDFMLPDGGWDNSFGTRNFKWTYYGSRTCDGCAGAFAKLWKHCGNDTVFLEAAKRNLDLLLKNTSDGRLNCGRDMDVCGQLPCVHLTFSHAVSLTDALRVGLPENAEKCDLPWDKEGFYRNYYPELRTVKLRAGKWLATVTAYDFFAGGTGGGAAHSSGGALSLLRHDDIGIIIAGSVLEYRRREMNNMQSPIRDEKHSSLIPRLEYEKDGNVYVSCLDSDAELFTRGDDKSASVTVKTSLLSTDGKMPELSIPGAVIAYRFTAGEVLISVRSAAPGLRFILPIVSDNVRLIADSDSKCREIFFLPGGFKAKEYTFYTDSMGELTVKIQQIIV